MSAAYGGSLTILPLDVMFGFDKHPQPVHLLPLQLVQLGPKIVVDKVQLSGKFALLRAQSQHATQLNTNTLLPQACK